MNRRRRLLLIAIVPLALASLGSARLQLAAPVVAEAGAARASSPQAPGDPGPPPGPICKPDQGEHCGSCFVLRPGHPWERACCTPSVEGGVTFVPAPFDCPAAPPSPPTPPPLPTTPACAEVILANDSTSEHCARLGVAESGGRFLVAVQEALETLDPPDPYPHDETTLYSALAPLLAAQGLCVGMYAEELSVRLDKESSENYDLLRWDENIRMNRLRRGPRSYRTTCKAAAVTQRLADAPGGGEPSTTPTTPPTTPGEPPTPPTPPTGTGTCPFTTADFAAAGKWGDIKITGTQNKKFNIDSTAKVCMRDRCHALGADQDCCPPGGPEGSPDRARCDAAAVHPVWVLRGGDFSPTGGEVGLGDNPFRNAVKGKGTIAVCGQGICSKALGFGGAADGPPPASPSAPPPPPQPVTPAPSPLVGPSVPPSPAALPPDCPKPTGIDFDVTQGASGNATKYAVQARFLHGAGPLRHECWPSVSWTNLAGQGNLQDQGGGLLLVWSKAHALRVRGCAGAVCGEAGR